MKLRVASLFSGAGGFDWGFHTNNENFEIVYANEINKDAVKSYEANYNIKVDDRDINDVEDLPDCDLMIGGFPCQSFSICNNKRSTDDKRNILYLNLVRLLKKKQPSYFVFENVKGIMSMGGYETKKDKKEKLGKILKMILNDFNEAGYVVHYKLFKMKYYNIPQSRERVIFLGIRKDLNIKFKWEEDPPNINKVLKDAFKGLPLVNDPLNIGSKQKIEYRKYVGHRPTYYDKVSPTILCNIRLPHPDKKANRRMTLREHARVQTFHDKFVFVGSMTAIYRQIGNAVPPLFSSYLAKLINKIDKQ